MAGTTKRIAAALALFVAVSAASRASSADEAPAAPPGLVLKLEPKTTYVYRYTESVSSTMSARSGDAVVDSRPPFDWTRCRTSWEVGLTLSETKPDGTLVISLLPMRETCTASLLDTQPSSLTFDSDDFKTDRESAFVGRAMRVTVSPSGRVLDAASPDPDWMKSVSENDKAATRKVNNAVSPDPAKAFAQRFLQELPTSPPRAATTWECPRSLAPEIADKLGQMAGVSRRISKFVMLGDVADKCVVAKRDASAVSATIASQGRTNVEKSTKPVRWDPLDPSSRLRLVEWTTSGAVAIDPATGLARTRTTKTRADAWMNAHLPSKLGPLPGVLPLLGRTDERETSAADWTYDIETRLELLDAR
jgi:hypothetical protein